MQTHTKAALPEQSSANIGNGHGSGKHAGLMRQPKLKGAAGCNSANCAAWYAQFARGINNRKICPVELGPSLRKDKADVFRVWLEEGSLMRVLLRAKRKATKSSKGLDKFIQT